uniref:Rieske (2Fe-2S) domain-containing protein (HcaC, bphF) n=1 Tax=uncultured marine thaumarchaeote KM3_72_A09 TaxID=1456261 RepID=A0A075HJ71_9ARCH|nr:Rieske (2Fe-2S) domain-containing protein (hcaC, bphF) [uncultured marine thaumarchaeote KM3_72_A09]
MCDISELESDGKRTIDFNESKILVVKIGDNIYAVDGICSHEYSDLSMGFMNGEIVTCPLHLSQFDLKTGEALSLPATEPLKRYEVKIQGTNVFVEVE